MSFERTIGRDQKERVYGTIQAVGYNPGMGFDLLVLLDDGVTLSTWGARLVKLEPERDE